MGLILQRGFDQNMAPIAQPPLRDKLLGSLSAEAAACPLPSRKFLG